MVPIGPFLGGKMNFQLEQSKFRAKKAAGPKTEGLGLGLLARKFTMSVPIPVADGKALGPTNPWQTAGTSNNGGAENGAKMADG